jgi:hypothetical protein
MKGSGSWSMESLHGGTPGVLALCWESGDVTVTAETLKPCIASRHMILRSNLVASLIQLFFLSRFSGLVLVR